MHLSGREATYLPSAFLTYKSGAVFGWKNSIPPPTFLVKCFCLMLGTQLEVIVLLYTYGGLEYVLFAVHDDEENVVQPQ